MKERLIPVKSEAELRVGMICVVRRSRHDGKNVRGMILAMEAFDRCFYCHADHTGIRYSARDDRYWCWARAIREGRLFRVDDGMDADKRFVSDDLVLWAAGR